uniref:ST6 N-acetylgalactosaminide alpha-2,6-sialyltransferase 4 n=1 Tax=Anser cygnoides TaxID=8845 RepID=A0A8B9EJ88_ANSCY
MKTLIRFFLALVCVAAVSVLYVLLCSLACLRPCCRAARRWDGPAYAAPAVLSFQGYSRVPDGQPLQRAPCRRCAVVSSSGQMLGSRLGQAIDGQECVLRMNHAPTAGYEEDVGTRSTVRVVSHTSVPLLLRNQPYFFQQSQETVYVIWGPPKKMSREKGGSTYRALLKVMETYPRLQIYTLTEEKMAYCDDVFQNETGKNRVKSGSFLSTGWFTMILAMELCERIRVFGMVSDSYCRCGAGGRLGGAGHRRGRILLSFLPAPPGRRTTRACLTTTSRRAGWTSAGCTWCTSGPPAPGTASSPRRPSSPAGPRGGTSSSPTRRGRAGRSGGAAPRLPQPCRCPGWKPLVVPPGLAGVWVAAGGPPPRASVWGTGLDPLSPPSCRHQAALDTRGPCRTTRWMFVVGFSIR